MKSHLIEVWSKDGSIIASRYQKKILAEGISSAKSIGERVAEKNFEFYSQMFKNIVLNEAVAILDIGCGKADLLSFFKKNYPQITINNYLGIDLVKEFLDLAQLNYPEYEFQQINFISKLFSAKPNFTIVVAQGVLVSRVSNYRKFVEYFIKKMVRCSSDYILFNLISEIDFASPNYLNQQQIGHSTSFSRIALQEILDRIENTSYHIVESQIFPDATDLFVQITIEK